MIGSRALGCRVIGGITLILLAIIILFHILSCNSKGVVGHMIVTPGDSRVYTEEFGNTIQGYEDGGIVYFFLPSYMDLDGFDYESSQLRIYEKNGNLLTNPEMNKVLEVEVGEDFSHAIPYKVGFYHSKNLCTLEISLNGNESDDIEHDNYTDAFMTAYSPEEVRVYTGEISIKGRGNSTWGNPKNPYEIKLTDKVSFCGMKPTDKWCLVANFFDDTKIINKMVYDTAANIGMEYAIESDWVDLYINGEYFGNYLMCHEPNISSTDLDIGNLEKTNRAYFDTEKNLRQTG